LCHLSKKCFLVDTGSVYSVIPYSSSAQATGPAITSAAGKPIPCWGWRSMAVKFGSVVYKWKFLLAAVAFPLLGADFLRSFRLVVDLHLFAVYSKGGKHVKMVVDWCTACCRRGGPILFPWFWHLYTFTSTPSARPHRLFTVGPAMPPHRRCSRRGGRGGGNRSASGILYTFPSTASARPQWLFTVSSAQEQPHRRRHGRGGRGGSGGSDWNAVQAAVRRVSRCCMSIWGAATSEA
jgi:hypothetical protein